MNPFEGTRIGVIDAVVLIARIAIVIRLCSLFTWWIALAIYAVLSYTLELTIAKVFNLECMNSIDKNSWNDAKRNPCNIMGALVIEKCDEALAREVFI